MNEKIYLSHRGNWHNNAIENTISSFTATREKLNNKLHGFECDFQQLDAEKEDSWIIFHDETMKRLNPNETTINIEKRIYQNNQSDKIPTLTEFCDWVKENNQNIIVNIEIKKGTKIGIKYLIQTLNEANINSDVKFIYSSFSNEIMSQLSNYNEHIGYLVDDQNEVDILAKKSLSVRTLFIAMSYENRSFINRLNELNNSYGIYFSSLESYKNNIETVENDPSVKYIFIEA